MAYRVHNVGDLRRVIKESSDEFKPVFGKDVEKDNKKINSEAYKEMEKATSNYDGGARREKKGSVPMDDNRGMECLRYDRINDDFKKRTKSQLKGYTSVEAEKLHKDDEYGNADFTDIKGLDTKANELKKGKDTAAEIGLTSRELNKKDIEDQESTIFGESKKITKLTFKNTVFMTEGHMMSRIPDMYKVEGKKFIMKDKANNEYLVEWSNENDPKVLNKTKINESINKAKMLMNYKSSEERTSNSQRLTEDTKINDLINKARRLM